MKIFNLFTFFFGCLFAFHVHAAEININLDKNAMSEGDTLNLTIDYNGNSDENPDLSALQQDFQIVSNYAARQINYINGTLTQTKRWSIGLKPLKTGKITIKPITLGGLSSNYAEVEVKEVSNIAFVPDSKENSNSPYFQIEQTFSSETPYVQQQLTVWVTIYDSLGLQGSSLDISDETQKNWTITPFSNKPFIKKDVINGKNMNVLTYVFAAFPLKSGKIAVPQFLFNGFYIKNVDFGFPDFQDDLMTFGVDFRNAFGQKVPVRMRTKPQNITIKPKPNGFSGVWLPLSNLTMQAEWSSQTQFKAGEALSRKITITAAGLPEDMFPALQFPDIEGFKQYPEKPETSMSAVDGQLVTTATINVVYIPEKAGKFKLPQQEIEWFNVNSGLFEKTTLPAEVIDIAPNTNLPEEQTEEKTTPLLPAISAHNTGKDNINSLPQQKKNEPPFLPKNSKSFYLYALISFVLFAFAFLMLMRRRKNHARIYRDEVIRAIKRKDYKTAKKFLLKWAKVKYGDENIANFNIIAEKSGSEGFSQQLHLLNQLLYSDNETFFDATAFISALKKADKQKINTGKKEEILPNLYD